MPTQGGKKSVSIWSQALLFARNFFKYPAMLGLVAIELNPEFVSFLREKIADPRLRIIQGSASDARRVLAELSLERADYIISGIPYSLIPVPLRQEILQQSRQLLHPDGALLVYQFSDAVLPYLKSSFGSVHQNFQLLNILPARIFHCTP